MPKLTLPDETKETYELPLMTGVELFNRTPEHVPWVVEPFIASGAITEIVGHMKEGKSTWIYHACRSIIRGESFLGYECKKGRVLYLTEERIATFTQGLIKAGFTQKDLRDIDVVMWSDTWGASWKHKDPSKSTGWGLVQRCQDEDYAVVIVDTLGQWSMHEDMDENDTVKVYVALGPLQAIAKMENAPAVVITRHARKSGGAVGQAGRGASALSGAVDIVMNFGMASKKSPNLRKLSARSRFDGVFELECLLLNGQYARIDGGDIIRSDIERRVLELVKKKDGLTTEQIADELQASASHTAKVLVRLEKQGSIHSSGAGTKSNPKKYSYGKGGGLPFTEADILSAG